MHAAAELHSFDRINQNFNFNFPQQTIIIKPEHDIKVNFKYNYPFFHTYTLFEPNMLEKFINDTNNNNHQNEFSFILSNNDVLRDENEVQLESLKIKAKIFGKKFITYLVMIILLSSLENPLAMLSIF
jgi:hypothetical protein